MNITKQDGQITMQSAKYHGLSNFLREELALSQDSVAIAERSVKQNHGSLPIVLWQYGLINLDELDRIYDWLDKD
jgi:hypothetical protein